MIAIWLVPVSQAFATYYDTGWIKIKQPDGTEFIGRMYGDEYRYKFITQDGYAFDKNFKDGFYYYASRVEQKRYILSNLRVGVDIPTESAKDLAVELMPRPLISENNAQLMKGSSSSSNMDIASTTSYTLKVVLVEFSDVKGDTKYTAADFENMLSGSNYNTSSPDGETVYGSMDYYYDRMSNGNISITATVKNTISGGKPVWLSLPHTKWEYRTGAYSFWTDAQNAANASGLDISTGTTTKLVYIYAGNFYLGSLNPSAQPWNNRYKMCEKWAGRGRYDSETHPGTTFSHIGIHSHEFGHLLGFSDLYYGSNAIVDWTLMGDASDLAKGARPGPINPHYRSWKGWIGTSTPPTPNSGINLPYNEVTPTVYKVQSGSDSYFIENRRYQDFSTLLPGYNDGSGGILVWHVKGTHTIDLIEADGAGYSSGDEDYGDMWPGADNKRNLNDFTSTNSNLFSGGNSNVIMHFVSDPGQTMTAVFGNKWFGDLPLDLTWSDNIAVGGEVTVPNNLTLTIDLGTTIQFDNGTKLTINGKLEANSSSQNQRITFTGTSATPGYWNGITINSGSSANSSTLRRCDVKYATTGITIDYNGSTNDVTIDKCRINNNSSHGIYVYGTSSASVHPTVTNNKINDNSGSGIYLSHYAKPFISTNRIEDNSQYGIYATTSSSATVEFNYLFGNGSDGLGFASNSQAQVHRNTVKFNDGGGISAISSSNLTAYGSGNNKGRNYIEGNDGDGLYSSNGSPVFGKNITNQYGNNQIQLNTGYQAQHQAYSGGQLRAEQCYWGFGGESDISGNVDNVPYLSSAPNPVGWGYSDSYDPSASTALPKASAVAGMDSQNGTQGEDFDPVAWQALFDAAMEAGFEKGEWVDAAEVITDLWRELQDSRIPNIDYQLLESLVANTTVESSVRKYLALALVEQSLAGQDINKALADMATYRQSIRAFEAELLANAGMIQLHFKNDVAAAQSVLAELQNKAGQGDKVAAQQVKLLTEAIDHYQQRIARGTAPKFDRDPDLFGMLVVSSGPSILLKNYPNPFNPSTKIHFTLPSEGIVTIRIFNLLGEKVRVFENLIKAAGNHVVTWDGRDRNGHEISSGVYIYQITYRSNEIGSKPIIQNRKMTLIR